MLYISNNQVEEIKKIIRPEDIQSPLTQALFLITEFNKENMRNTIQPQRSVNLKCNHQIKDTDIFPDLNKGESAGDDRKSVYTVSANIQNPNPFSKNSISVY